MWCFCKVGCKWKACLLHIHVNLSWMFKPTNKKFVFYDLLSCCPECWVKLDHLWWNTWYTWCFGNCPNFHCHNIPRGPVNLAQLMAQPRRNRNSNSWFVLVLLPSGIIYWKYTFMDVVDQMFFQDQISSPHNLIIVVRSFFYMYIEINCLYIMTSGTITASWNFSQQSQEQNRYSPAKSWKCNSCRILLIKKNKMTSRIQQ